MSSAPSIPSFHEPLPIDVFLESAVHTYIYDDLRQFEHAFLYFFKERNLNFDRPVALLADSSDELVFLIASCWRLGIPFVTIDAGLSAREQSQYLQQVRVELIICDQDPEHPDFSCPTVHISRFALAKILKPDFTPEPWVKDHKKNINPDQIFGYFFTSGTTGIPKIVPLKRRQVLYGAKASEANIDPGRNQLWLLSLPLHHVGGVSVILRSLLYGSGVYRMDTFDISRVTELLDKKQHMVAASMVPTMLKRLMKRGDFSVHDHFMAILLGGGPLDGTLVDECFNRGIPVVASYGMTETCAQIAANPLMTVGDLSRPRESVGQVFSPNRIEIRDESAQALEEGDSGQIWLKGPQVFEGYYQTKNQGCFFDRDGWFNTGDYGHLNHRGELFIEARRTDLIVSGGENVSPLEVEQALRKVAPVQEAAVVGVPDEEWGQKVVAAVVAKKGQHIDPDAIRQKLRSKISSFKVPKQIIQLDAIPRNKTGKVLRDKVQESIASRL
ncbi:o-succinylbenzoate--CoA ligase [Fodinibius sediminis]|uniref:2-succinylbenzoyl-CoA synthetase n=1 Tax=Fodinibius sediminis TaxID=1214077 RepID=A0A521DAE4_9BACT|nr:o-succinylbenzoate--CoA ligase [Fodinibius sediminis]SMO68677.1 2-succinylbenzoyl-CoA synthetase [Fodinibius sediminis]